MNLCYVTSGPALMTQNTAVTIAVDTDPDQILVQDQGHLNTQNGGGGVTSHVPHCTQVADIIMTTEGGRGLN